MAGEQWRDIALDRLYFVAGIGAGLDEEHIADAVEVAPAFLQRHDGVGEGGSRLVGGYAIDLGAVALERGVEGGAEMLRLDRRQWRQAERAGPVGEQGIVGGGGRAGHGVHLATNAAPVTPSAPAAR